MELDPSGDADSHSAGHEISSHLWNTKVYYPSSFIRLDFIAIIIFGEE
jgi:hypothetical protein